MTKAEIIHYNERLAVEKIRAAYSLSGLSEAMHLVHTYFGIDDLKVAYNKTCGICFDLIKGARR